MVRRRCQVRALGCVGSLQWSGRDTCLLENVNVFGTTQHLCTQKLSFVRVHLECLVCVQKRLSMFFSRHNKLFERVKPHEAAPMHSPNDTKPATRPTTSSCLERSRSAPLLQSPTARTTTCLYTTAPLTPLETLRLARSLFVEQPSFNPHRHVTSLRNSELPAPRSQRSHAQILPTSPDAASSLLELKVVLVYFVVYGLFVALACTGTFLIHLFLHETK